MPARLTVTLRPKLLHEQGLWADTGPAVQALVLRAAKVADVDLAHQLHDPGKRRGDKPATYAGAPWQASGMRPYATAPLRGPNAGGSEAPWTFEVGVLDDGLIRVFVTALEGAGLVKVGHSSFFVERVDVTAVTYADLVTTSQPATRWGLRLLTPTVFKLPEKRRVRRSVPLPAADRVFGSLARRFQGFAGPGLLPPDTETAIDAHLMLAELELRSQPHLIKGPDIREVGCVGDVVYTAVRPGDMDPAALRGLTALVRFAAFAGVGDHTTKGMGCAVPLDRRGHPQF